MKNPLLGLLFCQLILVCACGHLEHTTSSPPMPFSVSMPENWQISKIPAAFFTTDFCYGLRPKNWEHSDFALYLSIYSGSIESAATDYGWGFENNGWYFNGKREKMPATLEISSQGRMLRGKSHIGTLDEPWATSLVVVFDNGRGQLIVINSVREFEDELVFKTIVDSLRW